MIKKKKKTSNQSLLLSRSGRCDMTINDVIEEFGGFHGSLEFFGWQGGTIHQVREEWLNRLHRCGYVVGKDGQILELTVEGVTCKAS